MEKVSDFKTLEAPFGKEFTFQKIEYDNGFQFLRLRIKEGKRFTMVDLDVNTARACAETINEWMAGMK